LLEISFKDDSAKEVERIKRFVTLVRDVFVIWLAAAKDCSAIKEIVPSELEDNHYYGLASHNLARNIKGSRRGGKGERGRSRDFCQY
jgi:hypothetical protein